MSPTSTRYYRCASIRIKHRLVLIGADRLIVKRGEARLFGQPLRCILLSLPALSLLNNPLLGPFADHALKLVHFGLIRIGWQHALLLDLPFDPILSLRFELSLLGIERLKFLFGDLSLLFSVLELLLLVSDLLPSLVQLKKGVAVQIVEEFHCFLLPCHGPFVMLLAVGLIVHEQEWWLLLHLIFVTAAPRGPLEGRWIAIIIAV